MPSTYAMVNWTKRVTRGTFGSLEEARDSVAKNVDPGDEWSIHEFSSEGGEGSDVEAGEGAIGA